MIIMTKQNIWDVKIKRIEKLSYDKVNSYVCKFD